MEEPPLFEETDTVKSVPAEFVDCQWYKNTVEFIWLIAVVLLYCTYTKEIIFNQE